MLVLSRQRDEKAMIGTDETVLIGLSRKDRARLVEAVGLSPGLADLAEKLAAVEAGPIEVMVVGIRGDKVRLGIKAPKDMPVNREEVAERIRREGKKGR